MFDAIKGMFSKETDYTDLIRQEDRRVRDTWTKSSEFESERFGNKLDYRLITVFGNRFSEAAYARANLKFPNVLDVTMERLTKLHHLIQNCKPQSQVFYQNYGSLMLGFSAGVNSIYITTFFRTAFRLGSNARIVMYFPAVYFPTLMTGIINDFFVKTNLISEPNVSLTKLTLISSLTHLSLALFQPLLLTVVGAPYFSSKYYSYPVPVEFLVTRKGTLDTMKIIWSMMNLRRKSFLKTAAVLSAFNFLLAAYVTHSQGMEVIGLYERLLLQEEAKLKQIEN
ncbi:hypothetical protein HDE_01984 [Halotydeus destructor]|nr:hypothetical protein HDE_01984 [Halotydeus destructor]